MFAIKVIGTWTGIETVLSPRFETVEEAEVMKARLQKANASAMWVEREIIEVPV